MEESPVQWSDLPPELWPLIGQRLQSFDIDVLRFRSVCRSWRASLPRFSKISPLEFPFPFCRHGASRILLYQTIISCISPLQQTTTTKIHIRSLDRFLNHIVMNNTDPSLSNLLDSRIYEVARSYTLRRGYDRFPVLGIRKVVMCPNSVSTDRRTCTIAAVYGEGKLGLVRHGDEKWTRINSAKFNFQDVIVYTGLIYAIDSEGTLFWIGSDPDSNSWMESVQFSALAGCYSSHRKHLVECGGELYFVQRFFYMSGDGYPKNKFHCRRIENFHVYRLEEHGERMKWMRVMDLRDYAIVLGDNCCFSTQEFSANCIYFNHELRHDPNTLTSSVFNLKQGWISTTPDQIAESLFI